MNIDLFGTQITLKPSHGVNPKLLPEFHFGINMALKDFDALVPDILQSARERIVSEPTVLDAGTAMERKKVYLKCPTGYLFELKGYRSFV